MKGQPYRFIVGHNQRAAGGPARKKAYRIRYVPEHPHASSSGCVAEHILVVEAALGHVLRRSADVHHVDGNSQNNQPRNLVACHNRTYHKLLHVRTRIVRSGGNPNTQHVCSFCGAVKDRSEFYRATGRLSGLQNGCKSCMAERNKGRVRTGATA